MVSTSWEDICASNSGKFENVTVSAGRDELRGRPVCASDWFSWRWDIQGHIGRQFRHGLDQGLPSRVTPKWQTLKSKSVPGNHVSVSHQISVYMTNRCPRYWATLNPWHAIFVQYRTHKCCPTWLYNPPKIFYRFKATSPCTCLILFRERERSVFKVGFKWYVRPESLFPFKKKKIIGV